MKSRRPSAGLVVGITALIVATSGSAVAASLITSARIKDGTIQLKDISKKTRTALKGQRGPAGATGAWPAAFVAHQDSGKTLAADRADDPSA